MKTYLQTLMILTLFSALVLAQGSNQYYLSFDGQDDYVRYANDSYLQMMDGATDYTMETWIYPVGGAVDEYDRVLQRYYSFNISMYDGDNNGIVEDWYFTLIDGSGNHYYNTEGDATLTLDSWNHIVVINNSTDGSLKLFVNGTDVTTSGGYTNRDLRPSQSSDNLYIGNNGSSASYFDGYIDEVRLKNVAENPGDLNEDQNQNYASDANTALLLHFDEGTGSMTQNSVTAEGDSARLGGIDVGDDAEPAWIEWVPSAIGNDIQNSPDSYVLNQNYPNPFNPGTVIGYRVEKIHESSLPVKLTVYNILGKKIRTLVNENQPAGNYTVRFDGSALAPGIYFYRLQAGNRVLTKKMILTK